MSTSSDKHVFWPGYWLYQISTSCYFLLVKLLSPFNQRAKQLTHAQNSALKSIREKLPLQNQTPSIWFHVSSLGEYEQGKPIMEALKKAYPQYKLLVTFFSPSGYEARKKDTLPDGVYYLPFENKANAYELISRFNPVMAFWVKYDFWFHYLYALKQQNIPVYLIAALFRPNQRFFKPGQTFQREILATFTTIFCQNQSSLQLLQSIGYTNGIISGDTRFDRVSKLLTEAAEIPLIKEFKQNSLLLIAGSSYKIEEQLLLQADILSFENVKLIIAPHFTDPKRIEEIQATFQDQCTTYTALENGFGSAKARVLIIDRIGLLARAYRYADLAFIGGGFWENGLHNTLEAVTFGMPVCYGPKLNRFPEAQALINQSLGTIVEDKESLKKWLSTYIQNTPGRLQIAEQSREWVRQQTGATSVVLSNILPH